jgi:hypothetical protein
MRFSVVAAALFAGVALAAPGLEKRDGDYDYDTETPVATVTPYTTTSTSSAAAVITSSTETEEYPEYTTSTIYTTKLVTITSCHTTVTNCPAHSTVVVTSTIALSTTVCPVVKPTTTEEEEYYSTSSANPVITSTASVTAKAPVTSVYYTPYTVITVSSCVPTVTYSTVYSAPAIAKPTVAYPPPAKNATTPYAPYFTGAASSVSGSMAIAGLAALGALFLA